VVRELGSKRKLHCVLAQKCAMLNLTNIGETRSCSPNGNRAIPREDQIMLNEEKSYIAGFLDGDGCIMAQLVKHKDYIFGFQVRVSIVFYQKSTHQEILSWLKSVLKLGYIRQRNDGMTEYTIVGLEEVKAILTLLYPFLRLKKVLAREVLKLIQNYPEKMTPKELVRLSKLVDNTAKFTYSKKRTNTSESVKAFLKEHNLFPVETESQARTA
jgi:hypothetical protein